MKMICFLYLKSYSTDREDSKITSLSVDGCLADYCGIGRNRTCSIFSEFIQPKDLQKLAFMDRCPFIEVPAVAGFTVP